MKPFLFFDTETTGITKDKLPAEHPDQPRIVSLGAILCDAQTLRVFGMFHTLIIPDGWSAEADAASFAKHRLTDDLLNRYGMPIANAMNVMCDFLELGVVVAGHNVQFDLKMLRGELRRTGNDDYYQQTEWFDSAHANTEHCRLPRLDGKNGYKLPRLEEAYEFWLKRKYQDGHGSFQDALAVKQIAGAMMKAGIDIPIGKPKGADEKRHAPAPAPKSVTPAAAQAAAGGNVTPDDSDNPETLI